MSASSQAKTIAYFSMEIGLDFRLPTYSGGLGVLAGDTLKSAADLSLPVVGISLLHRKGYFNQSLNDQGQQCEDPVQWNPDQYLKRLDQDFSIEIEGQSCRIAAWRYDLQGVTGHIVPVYFLDTHIDGNNDYHKQLSDILYGGDERYRICQEAVLGMGGIKCLEMLGHLSGGIEDGIYHMNEGHAALLTLGLLQHSARSQDPQDWASHFDQLKRCCVFTTHTPVPAGHDRFDFELVERVLGTESKDFLQQIEVSDGSMLNMTKLALHFSRYVNGVAKRHGEVSQKMFPGHEIHAITNGVHAKTWTVASMQRLFDRYAPGWQTDNHYLRYLCEVPLAELAQARKEAKQSLIAKVKEITGEDFDPSHLTVGFARRAAEYKRGDLLFEDLDRIAEIAKSKGPLQFVFAGKAHPRDMGGKKIIARINELGKELKSRGIHFAYLPNYNMELGQLICGGVDIWLNNPIKPLEASGTSGMKAALNGVPSISTLDGWWVEGCIEGVTGWEIDDHQDGMKESRVDHPQRASAAHSLYEKLEQASGLFYGHPEEFWSIARNSIAFNGSYFNTQRMVEQYARNAYQLR